MKTKIIVDKDCKLKRPLLEEEGKRTGYSIQLLDINNILPVSIRMTQNIVLHNVEIFKNFGVYKNLKGERMRYYVYENKIDLFVEELKKHKYTHLNKWGLK